MSKIQPTFPIHIQNVGAIEKADIDLKPLTVFVGENSTGKTYTAYLIAYIFSKYSARKYFENGTGPIKYEELEEISKEIYKTGSSSLDLKKFIQNNTQTYFDEICKNVVPSDFSHFLASDRQIFDKIKINIELNNLSDIQYHHLSPHFLHFSFNCNNEICETCQELTCEAKTQKIQYNIDKQSLILTFQKSKEKQSLIEIKQFVYSIALQLLHRSIFNYTYFLGAERTGLSLLYHTVREERKAESKDEKNNADRKEKGGDINVLFSTPTKELFSHMANIFANDAIEERELKIRNKQQIKKYVRFAEILENEILSGEIEIKDFKKKKLKKLIFDYLPQNEKIPLNMTISASAVKGLSPLILYLRYFIEPNEIIVIDEPELNLHPKAQVQLIELLTMLANSEVYIVLTTHSPYIVDHLINLIKAANHKHKKQIANKFYLKNETAFIRKENVSAYLFEDNTAHNILEEPGHINWKTFSKISEEITDLYFELDD